MITFGGNILLFPIELRAAALVLKASLDQLNNWSSRGPLFVDGMDEGLGSVAEIRAELFNKGLMERLADCRRSREFFLSVLTRTKCMGPEGSRYATQPKPGEPCTCCVCEAAAEAELDAKVRDRGHTRLLWARP